MHFGTESMTSDSLTLTIPAQHPCFAGHFPGKPLVPGALLIQWLLQTLEAHYPDTGIARIRQLKFLQPVWPDCRLQIAIQRSVDKGLIAVTAHVDGIRVLTGRLESNHVD